MRKLTICLCFLAVMGFLCGNAMAEDITIPDGVTASDSSYHWWDRTEEDQEVEPGDVRAQEWDLEAFLYDKGSNTLTAVGGFNFLMGVNYGNDHYDAGDIFIDTPTIDASYGSDEYDNNSTNGTYSDDKTKYGYDYVLDMDYTNKTYKIYELDGDETFETVYFRVNDESNPYRYVSGGGTVGSSDGYSFLHAKYETDDAVNTTFSDANLDLEGGIHYAISVDLTPLWNYLGYESDFLVHLTIGCGNDNMMGLCQGGGNPPVPEPATMLLVGTGLVGLASLRKKFKKSS